MKRGDSFVWQGRRGEREGEGRNMRVIWYGGEFGV